MINNIIPFLDNTSLELTNEILITVPKDCEPTKKIGLTGLNQRKFSKPGETITRTKYYLFVCLLSFTSNRLRFSF